MGNVVRSSGGGRKPNLPANQKSKLTRISPPAELMGDIAIRLWKTQSKILIERGVFELEDAPILLAYCNAFHLMIEAETVIAKDGLTVSSEMGERKNTRPLTSGMIRYRNSPVWVRFWGLTR